MRILILSFAFFTTSAWANIPPRRTWVCQISADLVGQGTMFQDYGRDSWDGKGTLYCESNGARRERVVLVSFNSYYAGFGADMNSELQLVIDLITDRDPGEVQIRGPVFNQPDDDKILWSFASERLEAHVRIKSAVPTVALSSLQNGYIFVRGKN